MTETNKLSAETFTRFIQSQKILTSGRVTINFDGITFISPGGIVPVASVCEHLSSSGREIFIRARNRELQSRLIKTGFFHMVERIAVFEPAISQVLVGDLEAWQGANPLLIEITRLQNANDLSERLDKVLSILRFRMRYEPSRAYNATIAISEICQNTFDHNRDRCGFFSLQTFGEQSRRFTEICVSDYGIGLAESLTNNPNNPNFGSDIEAIKFAMKLGVSEFDDPTRGTGLHHLLRIAEKNEGSIQITSGSGTVRYRADKDEWRYFKSLHIPGVSIVLCLPA